MKNLSALVAALVAALALAAAPESHAGRIYIDVNAPTLKSFPIAVQDFMPAGATGVTAGRDITSGIENDLDISGLFRVIGRDAFLEKPKGARLTEKEIAFEDWASIGAEALVQGVYQVAAGRLEIEIALFDAVLGKPLFRKKYSSTESNLKGICHAAVNDIIREFTGEPGIFDTKIAFVLKGATGKEIHVMNLDGTGLTRITYNGSINLLPRWTPDGAMLSFTSYKGGNPDMYLLDLATGMDRKISGRKGMNIGPSWSPDGKSIAVALAPEGISRIFLLSPDGSVQKQLTNGDSIDVSPSFSPDGKSIAFVSNRAGNPHIFTMAADGSDVKRLTFEGKQNTSPAWSPRGDRLAFTGLVDDRFAIFTVRPDGSDLARLTGPEADSEDPCWAPFGRYVAFTSNRGGKYELFMMNSNGSNQRRIFSGNGDAVNPSWSPKEGR
jgi:TolB protein